MAKLTLANITSGYLTTVTQNANNTLISNAIENTLSRDGTTPNTMGANLDMNNNKITNLAAPTVASDAARLSDVTSAISGLPTAAMVPNTPAGNIVATNVQTALNELDTEKALLAGSASQTFSVAPATALTMAPEALQIQNQSLTAFTTAGTSTAYTLTPTPAITAYAVGQCFDVTFNATCGASPTLAISGLASPLNLVRLGFDGTLENIGAGEITSGMTSRCRVMSSAQILVERLTRPTKTGTWTPSVGGTATYTAQLGYYIDFGDYCLAWGVIAINVLGTGSTTLLTGIPFAPAGAGASYMGGSCSYWSGLAVTPVCMMPTTAGGGSTIQFNGNTVANANMTQAMALFGNSARVDFIIMYRK